MSEKGYKENIAQLNSLLDEFEGDLRGDSSASVENVRFKLVEMFSENENYKNVALRTCIMYEGIIETYRDKVTKIREILEG